MITHRVNVVTGELIPVGAWVREIDPEDLGWYERHWAEMDAFEHDLRAALALRRSLAAE